MGASVMGELVMGGAPAGGLWGVIAVAVGLAVAGVAAGAGARVLLGRLRRGARVAPPWCEIAVGGLWSVTGAGWASAALPVAWVPVLLALGWLGVAAGAVDVVHRRLPDALTVPALPVALLLLLPLGPAAVLRAAAGAAVAVLVHLAVHLALPRAMGAGDVKLAAPLGAVLAAVAWPALAMAALAAAGITAAAGIAAIASRRIRRGAAVAHGPSMLAATWLITAGLVAAGATGRSGGG